MRHAIKSHLMRVSVAGQGYKLYAGTLESGFGEKPLDVVSDLVPASYLRTQARLDQALSTGSLSWSMAFVQEASAKGPLVVYGSFLGAPDDLGRRGLFFVHALELVQVADLVPSVDGIVALLSNYGVSLLALDIGAVAAGSVTVGDFLRSLAERVEKALDSQPTVQGLGLVPPCAVAAIEHDCAGASAIAWSAMARLHWSSPAPWEVYDSVTGGKIWTRRSNDVPGRVVKASDILRGAIGPYLASATGDREGMSVRTPVVPPSPVRVETAPIDGPRHEYRAGTEGPQKTQGDGPGRPVVRSALEAANKFCMKWAGLLSLPGNLVALPAVLGLLYAGWLYFAQEKELQEERAVKRETAQTLNEVIFESQRQNSEPLGLSQQFTKGASLRVAGPVRFPSSCLYRWILFLSDDDLAWPQVPIENAGGQRQHVDKLVTVPSDFQRGRIAVACVPKRAHEQFKVWLKEGKDAPLLRPSGLQVLLATNIETFEGGSL